MSTTSRRAGLGTEWRLGDPYKHDHAQEDDAEQVEDLVEADLHGLLRDHSVEYEGPALQIPSAVTGHGFKHCRICRGNVFGELGMVHGGAL